MTAAEYLTPPMAIARPEQTIDELRPELSKHGHAVVLAPSGAYLGLLTVRDAFFGTGRSAGECLTEKPRCLETDDIVKILEYLLDGQLPAVPVFDSRSGDFKGVVLFETMVSMMRQAKLGIARVTIRDRIGSADEEKSKAEFLEDLSHAVKEPLQRISSLANLIREEEKPLMRLLFCSSIEAAVDQMDGTFDGLLKRRR